MSVHGTSSRPITDHLSMGTASAQPFATPTRTPRVLLRESGHTEEFDGAWWPWTTNLTAEVHDLVSVLAPRLGHAARISFDWNLTSRNQRRIDDADGIQLAGPDVGQLPDVMHLVGVAGVRLTLVVIPADADPGEAADQFSAAAGRSTRDAPSP
ncbi:DUF5994 family protein [Nocardia sp. NPDC056064]|uniref:DUF5994 family protein n=1 Tax=Nocardia sp. NPDC056064 TaxID=3345701 RepID=UPI0035D7C13A